MKTLKDYIFEARNKKIQPKTKDELVALIKEEVKKNGWDCDLNYIDVSRITDMSYLFGYDYETDYDLNLFYGDISKWDVSKVTNMEGMFYSNPDFNGDLSKWKVSKVENMGWMFCQTTFNNDISKWDVSNVKNMNAMFKASEFNGDISKWNVSNVLSMKFMFSNSDFNKDISKWVLNSSTDKEHMFDNCPIKEEYKPGYVKPTPQSSKEKQSGLEIELNNAIDKKSKAKIQSIIKDILLKNGKKSDTSYNIFFEYEGRFWNTSPCGLKYNKSKDTIYIDLYWQGDSTDGNTIVELSEVLFKDYVYKVNTGEQMRSEKDVTLDYLKQLVKKYNS